MKSVLDGHSEQTAYTHSSEREWKSSVMVEHGRLVVIRDHLFLSDHRVSDTSLYDR